MSLPPSVSKFSVDAGKKVSSKPKPSLWSFSHFVTAVAILKASDYEQTIIAFGLGNGTLRLVRLADETAHRAQEVKLCNGAVLSLQAGASGFYAGCDNGSLYQISPQGEVHEIICHKGSWIEPLAIAIHPERGESIAYGFGKSVGLIINSNSGKGNSRSNGNSSGSIETMPQQLAPHPSTVMGLLWVGEALFAAHFGGVTRWQPFSEGQPSRLLKWAGTHQEMRVSPDGHYLASALRDGELHVWRTSDWSDLRMAGYPGRVPSLAWSHDSLQLAGGGINDLLGWNFSGTGPEGKEPELIWQAKSEAIIQTLAAAPRQFGWCAGLDNGNLILKLIASAPSQDESYSYAISNGATHSALVWSEDGKTIAAGCEDGKAAIFRI